MKILKKFKENKGVTLTDVIIGMLILIMFIVILSASFHQIYRHNISANQDALIIDYALKILEYTDEITYEEVDNSLNDSINDAIKAKYQNYNLPKECRATITVKNYNENDEDIEDLIKQITLDIEYKVFNETKNYTVTKLKIKEL